jgi:hypothetical protein
VMKRGRSLSSCARYKIMVGASGGAPSIAAFAVTDVYPTSASL